MRITIGVNNPFDAGYMDEVDEPAKQNSDFDPDSEHVMNEVYDEPVDDETPLGHQLAGDYSEEVEF